MKVQGGDGAYADEMGCECGNPRREHDGKCLPMASPYAGLMPIYRKILRREHP